MKLPKQAVPVQRKISTTTMSSKNSVNGVEASGFLDDIVKGTVAPIVAGLI